MQITRNHPPMNTDKKGLGFIRVHPCPNLFLQCWAQSDSSSRPKLWVDLRSPETYLDLPPPAESPHLRESSRLRRNTLPFPIANLATCVQRRHPTAPAHPSAHSATSAP